MYIYVYVLDGELDHDSWWHNQKKLKAPYKYLFLIIYISDKAFSAGLSFLLMGENVWFCAFSEQKNKLAALGKLKHMAINEA